MKARNVVMSAVVVLLSPALVLAQLKPDLLVSALTLDADCRIDVSIRNIGQAVVPAAAYGTHDGASRVRMSRDGAPWGEILLGIFDWAPHLSQPVWGTRTYKWFSTLALPPGSHSVKVDVDYNDAVVEFDETNNSRTEVLICQKAFPDLVPTNIILEQIGPSPSSPCFAHVTVQNAGPGIVPEGNLCSCSTAPTIHMYANGGGYGGIILVGFDPNKVLQPAGGTLTRQWFNGPLQQLAAGAWHVVRLDIDDNNKLVEVSDANNSLTKRLFCGTQMPPTPKQP